MNENNLIVASAAQKTNAKNGGARGQTYSTLRVLAPNVWEESQRIEVATLPVTQESARLQSQLNEIMAISPHAGIMVIDALPSPRREEIQPFTESFVKGIAFATGAGLSPKKRIGFSGFSVWQQAVRENPSDQSVKKVLRCMLFFNRSPLNSHGEAVFGSLIVPPMTIDTDGGYLFSRSTLTILERVADPLEIEKRTAEIGSFSSRILSVGCFNQRGNVPTWVKP